MIDTEFYTHSAPKYKTLRNNKVSSIFVTTAPFYFINKVIDENEWSIECIRTFQMLPKLPIPFSASQKAKEWNISHITAKKIILRQQYKYIQLTKKHFIEHLNCNYDLFFKIIHSNQPISLINAINNIRDIRLYDIEYPTKKEILKFLDCGTHWNVLIKEKILKKVQVFSKKRWFYFIPWRWWI